MIWKTSTRIIVQSVSGWHCLRFNCYACSSVYRACVFYLWNAETI